MQKDIDELVAALFKRGFNPHGVIYVLRLLADEHPEGSKRNKELEAAAQYFTE
jgi:hypothetical protein